MYVKNHRSGDPWLPGEIVKVTGPVSYRVKMADGSTVSSHQDYLRRRFATTGVEHPNIQPNEDLDELASRMSEDLGLVEPRAPSQEPEEHGMGTTEPPPVSEPERGAHPLVPCTSSESTAVAVQRPEPTSSTPGTRTCSGEHHVQPTKVYPRRDRRTPQYYRT